MLKSAAGPLHAWAWKSCLPRTSPIRPRALWSMSALGIWEAERECVQSASCGRRAACRRCTKRCSAAVPCLRAARTTPGWHWGSMALSAGRTSPCCGSRAASPLAGERCSVARTEGSWTLCRKGAKSQENNHIIPLRDARMEERHMSDQERSTTVSCGGGVISFASFVAAGYAGFAYSTGMTIDPVLYKALLFGPTAAGTAINTLGGLLVGGVGGGIIGGAVASEAKDSLESIVGGGALGAAAGSVAMGGCAAGCSVVQYGISAAVGYGLGYLVGRVAQGF